MALSNQNIFSTYLKVNVSISFLVFGGNENAGNTYLSFCKTKLDSHSIQVRSFTLQLFKTISGICSKNNGGRRQKC